MKVPFLIVVLLAVASLGIDLIWKQQHSSVTLHTPKLVDGPWPFPDEGPYPIWPPIPFPRPHPIPPEKS